MTVRRRTNAKKGSTKTRKHAAHTDNLDALLPIGAFHRNEVTLSKLDRLRDLIDRKGWDAAAEEVGVCDFTLSKVTSGFGHKLRPETAAKVREYLDG